MEPVVVDSADPGRVVWSSLWRERADVRVQFDLVADQHGGTDLRLDAAR
ncbi:hypothetical protein M2272_001135 [Mycobacterium frederiksbergense]|uniref:Uncharacterized protein n=1 Tax=Mycolicibacterium frederiksbergense TaxID=117567 RepID=A0ABT6KW99_9MYCO|nr:hypothetical protein [Mycolicibacterium frederiksbergense]MDH6194506.1 hypothetical protein [Mycolicibacterium frederiksbergense]